MAEHQTATTDYLIGNARIRIFDTFCEKTAEEIEEILRRIARLTTTTT